MKILKIIFFLILGYTNTAQAFTAKEIMLKNEEARRLKDVSSNAKLLTSGGGRSERTKEFTWWRKLNDGVHFNTLTRFHSPAEVKNDGILFLERGQDQTEVFIYLPAYKKIRRVESGQQSGSFMGSEFSYADIATPHVDDFNFKLLKEEKCPAHVQPASDCYVVEYTPNKEDVSDRTGSAMGMAWVREDNFMDVQNEIYDMDKKPWKKLEATEIKEIDSINKKWLAHHLKMENLKTGRVTEFIFSDVKANKGIDDATFSQQNLSKEK
jgi:outer membrane lipoprotein-sorting protein